MSDQTRRENATSTPRAERSNSSTMLGSWLRKARFDRQLSQTELASRAGLSRSYVSNIERGYDIRPSVNTLDLLGTALGVSRTEMLTAAGILEPAPGTAGNEREERFLTVVRSLNEDDREAIERFARFLQSEERRWSQPRLIEFEEQDQAGYRQQTGPGLFDNFESDTFESADVASFGSQ